MIITLLGRSLKGIIRQIWRLFLVIRKLLRIAFTVIGGFLVIGILLILVLARLTG